MSKAEQQHECCCNEPGCCEGEDCCAEGGCGCGEGGCCGGQKRSKGAVVRKLGIGAAVLALPIAAVDVYLRLQSATEQDNRKREQGAAYDDSAIRQVDPALISHAEVMRIETGFAVSRAVAVDGQGRVWVAGDSALRRFSATGAKELEVALAGEGQCLAVAGDGRVAVGYQDHVQILDGAGQVLATWPSLGKRAYLTSIAFVGDEVYVADAGQWVVHRCDGAGEVLGQLGKANASAGLEGLVLPSLHLDVAGGADGTVWVANPGRHRLENYDKEGELQRFWGEYSAGVAGFVGCCNPCDFALLPDGSFVTVEKSLPRVKIHDEHGKFVSVVAAPEQFATTMTSLDVAVDAQGRVFVLEPASKSVRVFAAGALPSVAAKPGRGT